DQFYKNYSKNKKSKQAKIKTFRKKIPNSLLIKGAKEHNLKDLDLEVPLKSMVAITGVSGSGKSTVAKDIIYAEGQRRYLDCLSPYARQFIKELKKPDLDSITNIPPTICVYQHTFQPSRLSTIGTMSEVYNLLRLLYSKLGTQYCPTHSEQEISPLSAEEIAEDIKDFKKEAIRILAPIIKNKKGLHKEVFQRAINSEINEIRVDGILDSPSKYLEGLERSKTHSIDYTIAKFTPANLDFELIVEAVQYALSLGAGTLSVVTANEEWIYSRDRTCSTCKRGFFKPDPEDLSFNSRRGVCDNCSGTGMIDDEICSVCDGARINAIGRNIRIGDLNIAEACYLNPVQLKSFLDKQTFTDYAKKIAEPILKEIYSKLSSLVQLGLEYLPLDRDCSTLSSGELQRLRISAAVGSPLTGVMYIFDEPSACLHPLDNQKVLEELKKLNERGNSVLLIEHDEDSILACKDIIDIGPGGGRNGGEIVFNGDISSFLNSSNSETARALRNQLEKNFAKEDLVINEFLHLESGICNNIESIKTKIPLGTLTVVCGVSGAGKSSLVHGVLAETVEFSKLNSKEKWEYETSKIHSDVAIERFLEIDQTPIGANSRSTPASYLKIWDQIRKLYASSIEAKARGWDASYFSYNTGKGRCPECQGKGELTLEMSFLADAKIPCETCDGKRYNEDACSIIYLGLNISEVLDLTFEEAKTHFANHKSVHRSLHQACELGLGYLSLGQSSASLSGGESQRLKLVSELSLSRKGHTVYILDEPTTGLHKADVGKLIKILHSLKEQGHSLIVIEHDPALIESADYIIEMGPGPAEKGGKIIFNGKFENLKKAKTPWGNYLSNLESKKISLVSKPA
ncbi:MAG: excinuclease ABC subunit UvrA, partial [Bdellovibrionales bacterium]|nr:excinuclease ABC subunit UvrA [Bdellovibrionales bacterium]